MRRLRPNRSANRLAGISVRAIAPVAADTTPLAAAGESANSSENIGIKGCRP
jgi:hypothetical protein